MKLADDHNKRAPYWAGLLIILALAGLSTIWVRVNDFWQGYMLDVTGPAWNYILVRGLYTRYANNFWTRLFTPVRTYIGFIIVSFGIELAQYLKLYEATFDYWHFLAYLSVLTPLFIVDLRQTKLTQ